MVYSCHTTETASVNVETRCFHTGAKKTEARSVSPGGNETQSLAHKAGLDLKAHTADSDLKE